jgi:hypothetical protein
MDPNFQRLKIKVRALLTPRDWASDIQGLRGILLESGTMLGPQGQWVVFASAVIIMAEILGIRAEKDHSSYALLSRDWAFAVAMLLLGLLFPLFPEYGFVYGR